jgi:hypothetical protein
MKLDLSRFYSLQLGGAMDTAALGGIGFSLLAANPMLAPVIPTAAALGTAAAGSGWLFNRLLKHMQVEGVRDFPVRFPSDEVPFNVKAGDSVADALMLGYTTDKGKPFWLPYEDAMRHMLVCGQSGVGKTIMGSLLMGQHLRQGGSLLWIDGKLDPDNLEMLHKLACWCGRESDMRIINPGDPKMSNSHNPILFGDPDEIASRILSLIPSTENNPGTDHYKQAANQGIATLVGVLQACKLAYNFLDLTILLTSPEALRYLENLANNIAPHAVETRYFSIFLSSFRGPKGIIDMAKLRTMFGGIGGRMFLFGTGNFGKITSSYAPEVELFRDLTSGKIIYVMLPTMGKDVAANNYGKMTIGDMRSATANIQALPKEQRPWPPVFNFWDEFGSFAVQSVDRMFEQSRASHQIICPSFQTFANVEVVSKELKEMVEGSTWTKIYFKLGSQASAELASELIGQERRILKSLTRNDGESDNQQFLRVSPVSGRGSSAGLAIGEREQDEAKVSSDILKSLDKGECVVTYGGDKVYNLRIPRMEFSQSFLDICPPVRVQKVRGMYRNGINLFRKMDEFLTADFKQELANQGRE